MKGYLDESGDLGFNKESSKVFVIVILIQRIPNQLRKCIRDTKKNCFKKSKNKAKELKFNKSSNRVKKYLLKKLSNKNIEIYYICLYKEEIPSHLRKADKLYMFLSFRLIRMVKEKYPNVPIELKVDKSLSKNKRADFDRWIMNEYRVNEVVHELSQNSYGLQAVDFIAGAIFRKYERDDGKFFEIIKDKVVKKIDKWKDIY